MPHLLKLLPPLEQPVSRKMTLKGQLKSRPLSQANQEAMLLLGNVTQPSPDPHGQCLRQARLVQQKDPADLSTQACISLAQLYNIESGCSDLFYTPELAVQAKKRVARLLGKDWETIASGPGCTAANSTVTKITPVALVMPASATSAPVDDIAVPRLITASADTPTETTPLPLPAATALSTAVEPEPAEEPSKKNSSWAWVIVLTLIAGLGTQWPVLAQMWSSL